MIANKGLRLGRTKEVNCWGVTMVAIENTLGRMYGRRWGSFIWKGMKSSFTLKI